MTEQIAQRVEPTQEVVSESKPQVLVEQQPVITKPSEKPLEIENYLFELWRMGEAQNHFEMPTLTNEINDFVLSEIKRQGLKNSRETYKEIVEHYEKKLNLPDGVDVYTKTEQVLELMKIDRKLIEAAREKEELLKKDITELSSKQLRDRIENGATNN